MFPFHFCMRLLRACWPRISGWPRLLWIGLVFFTERWRDFQRVSFLLRSAGGDVNAASDVDRSADSLEDPLHTSILTASQHHVKYSHSEVRLAMWEMTCLASVLAFLSGPSACGAAAGTVNVYGPVMSGAALGLLFHSAIPLADHTGWSTVRLSLPRHRLFNHWFTCLSSCAP